MSKQTMAGYCVTLLMVLAVGMAYGLVQVRSLAPPLIALVGLLLGEQAAKRHLAPSTQAEVRQGSSNVREPY